MSDFFGGGNFEEIIDQAEFAVRVKLTPARISQLVHPRRPGDMFSDGTPVLKLVPGTKKLNYKESLISLKRFYDEQEAEGGKNPIKDLFRGAEKPDGTQADDDSDFKAINESKRTTEHFKALTAKLEYEEMVKQLVRRDAVEKAITDIARKTYESFMNIPPRTSAIYAAETDQGKMFQMQVKDIRECLSGLEVWVRLNYDPSFTFEEITNA